MPKEIWAKINQKLGQRQKLIVHHKGRQKKAVTKGETIKITPFKDDAGNWVTSVLFDETTKFQPVGKSIKSLLLPKIAYEFLAVCLGKNISSDEPELIRIRHTLKTLDAKNAFVEKFPREEKYCVPEIAFEGNNPFARIQVRLFGSMAYRVNCPKISLGGIRLAYTQALDMEKDWMIDRDDRREIQFGTAAD